jgi:acid stress-induced BolA-like protein IbaG/YrbA
MTKAKREAFLKGIESGRFQTDKVNIYLLLKDHPRTLEMLIYFGYPEKTASARISDLMDLGLVEARGDNKSFFHVVTEEERQNFLMIARQQAAYTAWKVKGERMDWFSGIYKTF